MFQLISIFGKSLFHCEQIPWHTPLLTYYMNSYICIPVRGRIKETARVDNLVIPQRAGWITSYPPIVNGYVIQTLNTKL